MSLSDAAHRWGPVVDRLKNRLGRRLAFMPPNVQQAVSDTLTTCESLLQALAACQLDNADLNRHLKDLTSEWAYLFEQMPIACVATDPNGIVIQVNRSAGELVNMSPRALENRLLTHFIQDREAFSEALQQVAANARDVRASFAIRPRERAPLMIDAIAIPRTPIDSTVWLWFLIPHRASSRTRPATSPCAAVAGDDAR